MSHSDGAQDGAQDGGFDIGGGGAGFGTIFDMVGINLEYLQLPRWYLQN